MPKVSVVIPSYNHEKYIDFCIRSVLNQTFQDFEIIITDDGSQDKTVEYIHQFNDPRIKLLIHDKNKGPSVATNTCIKNSSGEFIACLGSDDAWVPEKLEKQVRFLENNLNISAVFTREIIIDQNNNRVNHNIYSNFFDQALQNQSQEAWTRYFFFIGNCLCAPSSMIRRNIFDEVGLFDERLAGLQDLDLWIKISLRHDIHVIDDRLTLYRVNDNHSNLSSDTPENRARNIFEYKQILNNYLQIKDVKFFKKVFPESRKYGKLEPMTIPYFLGRIALDTSRNYQRQWGVETIYNFLGNGELANSVDNNCGFSYADLLDLTKKTMGEDVYVRTQLAEAQAQVAQKEQSVQALTAQVAEKDALVAEKERAARELNNLLQGIYSSTSWRLIQVLWKIRFRIAPLGSRRERFGQLVFRGLRLWKQEGITAVWRKMIEKLKFKKKIEAGFTSTGQDKGEGDIPQVSIIIPVYNALSLTQECIRSIYLETEKIPFEIIVVDNASTDKTPRWLASESKKHSRFEVLRMEQNIGFGPAVNAGIARGRGDFIVILNNDTIVGSGWLDNLLAAMDKDTSIGIISPVTNYVGEGPQIDENATELPPNFEATKQYARSIENRSDIIYEPNRLVFFCVLLKRDLVNIIGDLDTGYEKGNFEDDDYCLRTRMAGYRLAIARNSFVYHRGSATFAANKISHSQHMEKNRQRFYGKVGRIATSSRQFISRPVARSADVSVIVRTVNRPLLLQRALTSLENQTYNNFEIVVVNDGGEDVSNILTLFGDRLSMTYVNHKSSKGRTAALNAGIKRSRGKWLSLLDDDDILYPWHLEALEQTAENSGYKFIYSDYNKALFLDSSKISPIILAGAPPWEFKRQELLTQNRIPIHTWLLARECIEKLGPMDPSLDRLEDYEYLLRLSTEYDFYHLKKVTCEYRYYLDASNSIYIDRQKSLDALEYLYQRYPVENPQILFKRQELIEALKKQVRQIEELRKKRGISMTEGEVNRAIIRLVVGL